MRALSFIDELSGTRNRRGFFLLAGRKLSAAHAGGAGATVVLAVVRGLADANAWHGRAAGTELIRDAARALSAAFGPDDLIARLGGGEFVVLTASEPEDVRERIAAAVKDRNELAAERPYKLDLAVGVASAGPGDALTVDDLIAAADRDLHDRDGASPPGPPPVRAPKAKRAGRGQQRRSAAA